MWSKFNSWSGGYNCIHDVICWDGATHESNVTLQHKTSCLGQILESEILVLCDSVLLELSTNIDIIIQ
jgi:hypothetical protein